MNTSPEADFDLELHFLPAWAKKAPEQNRYENYAGEPERFERMRGPRRDGPPHKAGEGRDRGERRPKDGQRPQQGRGRDRRRDERSREAPAPAPLPEVAVAFIPEEKGVDSLARQIKMTGRAYPLFDIAHMILQKPERHSVTISSKRDPEGKPLQLLYVCALDDTVWLSEDEAIRYSLDKHFATFYQPERTKIEGPKGTYTFVAQCGMSGTILGPPNYHDYQNQLRKLHAERFSRMPFEAFKARVKIVKDEAVVKQWLDEQSWKTEFICLNMPEPLKLASREEVEKHFREVHAPNVIKQVETFKMSGMASRQLRTPALVRAVRHAWEEQKRFPLQVATVLSQQFAAHGLQFFKVNKTVTHVAIARPHYLDLDTVPVSEGVRKIVDYINAHSRCSRRPLIEALVPGSQTPAPAPTPEAPAPEPSPEVTAVIADLHWLIHQGHVIEFANGALETAKKPLPRPPKPTPVAEPAQAVSTPSSGAEASVPPPNEPEMPDRPAPELHAAGSETTEGENQPQAAEASAATEATNSVPPAGEVAPETPLSAPEKS
ncbi:MAG: hypothetical protein L0Y58_20835 [Verrucomicrobia subdivision 3 bacterium]|nr:hypothetical protein [Limisphaerales bacterium]